MKPAPLPPNEAERLAALRAYDVLDTPAEAQFDDLTELAARICEAPIALISLIDEDRQWFKSRVGLDAEQTERNVAFCSHAILQPDIFIVEDATQDDRFADNPLVTGEPRIRFYAGAPLITPEGHALGTLCVIDREPRELTPDHQRALRVLSRHVMTQLELRRRNQEALELRAERIQLIAQLEQEQAQLEQRIAERTAELRFGEAEKQQQLVETERSRRALLSVLEDRQLAETEAQRRGAVLERVFQSLPDLFFLMDPDGTIRDYRAQRSSALYAAPEAFLGKRMQDVLPPDIASLFNLNTETVRLQGGLATYEYDLSVPDGLRHYEARLSLLNETGQFIAVVRDITERKDAERALLAAHDELEARVQTRTHQLAEANKELESFAYAVAHDLKAPLRGIDGYSRLLVADYDAKLDADGQQYLDNITRGVTQMNELIDDLLAYSRMERRSLQHVAVAVRPLVEKLLAEFREVIDRLHVQVEIDLPPLTVHADPDGLAVVIRNLLDNALKFSCDAQPPLIRIGGQVAGKLTQLTFADNGIGFDMRFHDKIFEIFQRLQHKESYPGTGVGLALVRKAMQRMGAQIRAESTPGQGAVFVLEFTE